MERVLIAGGVHRRALQRIQPSAVILAYHNVVPQGEPVAGDLSLHLDQEDFSRQLDVLQETHDVVALEDLLPIQASWTRPRAAITFDDAYQGALTAGLEELARRDLPATIMVAPGILGEACWWDVLSPVGGGPLSNDLREHALSHLGGRNQRVLDWASSQGLSMAAVPDHAMPATEGDVVEAASAELVWLGVHTWSHPNVLGLSAPERQEEFARARDWIRVRTPHFSDWLAYPYGLHDQDAVTDAARIFAGALKVEGGVIPVSSPLDPHRVPRINIPRGVSLDGFRLRVAGVL